MRSEKKDNLYGVMCVARGFTLIELLVVVLIIGILAAVALPQYNKAVVKSRTVELQSFLSSAEKALDVYALNNDSTSGTLAYSDLDIDLVPGWECGNDHSCWNPRREWIADVNKGGTSGPYVYIAGQNGVFDGLQIWAYKDSIECHVASTVGDKQTLINICKTLAGNDSRWSIHLPS